jgi:hypothetical protein
MKQDMILKPNLMANIFCPGVRCSSLRAIPDKKKRQKHQFLYPDTIASCKNSKYTGCRHQQVNSAYEPTVMDFKRQTGYLLRDDHHGPWREMEGR